jgi:UDPglucose--hexose-1-phosphate uridylyltransferase
LLTFAPEAPLVRCPDMSSLRRDPFGEAWVLMVPERGLMPSDFGSAASPGAPSPLEPGREGDLPDEIQALRPHHSRANDPDWRARVVAMPASPFGDRPFTLQEDALFVSAPASGHHELVIEHPARDMTLEGMPREHLHDVLRLYRDRLAFLAERPGVRHVQLTRSVGRAAGALYEHPHAQVLALPVTNRWMEEEARAAAAYHDAQGRCLFCDVVEQELVARERLVTANPHFVAITPWASKSPFETWVLPREHQSAFAELGSDRIDALGDVLQTVLRAFAAALDHPPYNLILHTRPQAGEASYHWHIELLPRLTRNAGFDWGGGYYVNPTLPEDAAHFLRQASALAGAVA